MKRKSKVHDVYFQIPPLRLQLKNFRVEDLSGFVGGMNQDSTQNYRHFGLMLQNFQIICSES